MEYQRERRANGKELFLDLPALPPSSFDPVTDIVGGGPFGLGAWDWTDDTSMALCRAESLIETGKFDPVDQMNRYLLWYGTGLLNNTGTCFDIGDRLEELCCSLSGQRIRFPDRPTHQPPGTDRS